MKNNGKEPPLNVYGNNTTTDLNIKRPVYQLEDLNRDHHYEKPSTTCKETWRKYTRNFNFCSCLFQVLPVFNWLPKYSWRKSFMSDLISGATVAVMHIPQGLAYALLGNVPPIVGIYMAFFPVLVYFIFGTSRHVSMGTFAIVCLMTGKVVSKHSTIEILQNGTSVRLPTAITNPTAPMYSNVEVATTVTFTVAMFQIAMYFLRLGILSTLLSETLVNGFTCASAFHVVSSQLKDLLGLTVEKRRGNFSFILTIVDAIQAIPDANKYVWGVSLLAVILLVVNDQLFKPWLSRKTRIPFPIELVAVVLGTAISYLTKANEKFDISIVGRIPTGLPHPALPAFSLIPEILLDSFAINMVSYAITMSMALIFARKLMYEVDSNQELLAMGASNTVGSFFSCLPITASLSRSMIQQNVGGVTQIASIVSCTLLLGVLLWIGPCFESLPRCVLASIIVVALKGMLKQCTSIIKYWKLSKWDALVWIVTFCTTLFVQISVGLASGVAISLLSIFMQGYTPYTCILGVVPGTDLYLDTHRYKGTRQLDGIKIFHYSGGLSFASRTAFKNALNEKIDFDAAAVLRKRSKMEETETESFVELTTRCVILDFSALTYTDPSGVDQLRQFQSDFAKLDIVMYIAGCSGPVYEMFIKCDRQEKIDSKFMTFPTVHDAVLFAQSNVLRTKNT